MIEDWEVELLINEIYECHGFDFSEYSRASFKRRVARLYSMGKFDDFGQLLSKMRTDSGYINHMIEEITVNVTEMFRDPQFYKTLREDIIPKLASKPFIRIWHAGCASGEEVYSMAILLKEAGLLDKAILYATDINSVELDNARRGIFPLKAMKQYSENYLLSGGTADFSKYYSANYSSAIFDETLAQKMVFAQHNLVSDRSFNEFDMVICRNVMIYFDKSLQERVLTLFDSSLSPLGFLALGAKETLNHSNLKKHYKQWLNQRIWQRKI